MSRLTRMRGPCWILVLCVMAGIALPALGQEAKKKQAPSLPPPDVKDASYGPHERNVLDLWKAKSDRPTPLVIFIHGGGFRSGDKSNLPLPLLQKSLKAGFSVASINYRLTQQATYPAPMLDSARAVQFLRSKAGEWNLDTKRFAASGGSAGAGISLWLGFHDDLADPKSDDPVARQSTRLACMGVLGAQTTYDPRAIKELVGGKAHEHSALLFFYGITKEERDAPGDSVAKQFEDASPMTHLSAGDPPAFLYYTEGKGPLPDDAKAGDGIHHPNFGVALQKKVEPLGVECVVRHLDDYRGKPRPNEAMFDEMVAFFAKAFADQK